MLIIIAWKNIWRNKTRSLIVMGSVILGLWVGAFMMAYVFGMIDQRLRDAVENEISHFQVHHPVFDRDNEPEYYLENGSDILEKIANDPQTRSATARCNYLWYGGICQGKCRWKVYWHPSRC